MPKVPLAILPVVFLIRQGIVLPHALKQRRGAPLRRSAPTRAPLQRLAPHLRKPAGNGGKNWDVTQKNEDVAPQKNWLQGMGVGGGWIDFCAMHIVTIVPTGVHPNNG